MSASNTALKTIILETIEQSPTIGALKSDVATLKSDVATLKSDVATLKSDVATLKSDVATLKSDVRYHGVMMEEMKSDLKLILDAVIPARQRAAQVDEVYARVDDHEHRLCAVESLIKTRDL